MVCYISYERKKILCKNMNMIENNFLTKNTSSTWMRCNNSSQEVLVLLHSHSFFTPQYAICIDTQVENLWHILSSCKEIDRLSCYTLSKVFYAFKYFNIQHIIPASSCPPWRKQGGEWEKCASFSSLYSFSFLDLLLSPARIPNSSFLCLLFLTMIFNGLQSLVT